MNLGVNQLFSADSHSLELRCNYCKPCDTLKLMSFLLLTILLQSGEIQFTHTTAALIDVEDLLQLDDQHPILLRHFTTDHDVYTHQRLENRQKQTKSRHLLLEEFLASIDGLSVNLTVQQLLVIKLTSISYCGIALVSYPD